MPVRKKSADTLKQQKSSFLNYIKNEEKYSKVIADLFLDDELEKIDDVESVKQHLEEKGISKELIDSLETDYESYLKGQSFYGPIDNYPDDIKELVRKNDKVLNKVKRSIVKGYKNDEEIFSLDIQNFVDSEFGIKNNQNLKKIKCDGVVDVYNIKDDIVRIEGDIKRINIGIEYKQDEIRNLQKERLTTVKKLGKTRFFERSEKKRLKSIIDRKDVKIKEIQEEIVVERNKIKEKNEKISMYTETKKLVDKVSKRKYVSEWKISSNYDRTSFESIKKSIGIIKKEISDCVEYLPNDALDEIKKIIITRINEVISKKKQVLYEKIGEYLSYFYYGERKNGTYIQFYDYKGHFYAHVPTVYSKNRIDREIVHIVNQLGGDIENIGTETVDYDFMNDVFIHTTSFRVLDEILEEGGLISTYEARKRSNYNIDIKDSITQEHAKHKDIYFSRGFRKNGYGKNESDNDYVFIVNTMNNFANSGYGVPLNNKMQPNFGLDAINALHDTDGYSIISKSALEKSYYDDSYSKIDIKDVYIFVSETKKEEIESNSKYKKDNANIIYIPQKYSGRMSYELYNFIKREIELRNKIKTQKTLIPNKIITSKDGIESIDGSYKWAFCSSIWGNTTEVLFNPLEKVDYKTILSFLKTNPDVLGFTRLKERSNFEIDYHRLENFLSEKKSNIDNFEFLFEYPKELLVLIILCIKVGLYSFSDSNKRGVIINILRKLKEFGYSERDLGILCKSVEWICYIMEYKNYTFIRDGSRQKGKCTEIKNWCDDRLVDFNKMKDFLIKISDISLKKYEADLVKDVLK